MSTARRIGVEAAVALAVGVLSWIVAPPVGVQLHWNPEAGSPWRAPSFGYALVVPFLAFALAHVVTSVINAGSEHTQRPLRAECAAGVALIAFAGLQRIPSLSVLVAVAGAVVLGLAVYSVTSRLS